MKNGRHFVAPFFDFRIPDATPKRDSVSGDCPVRDHRSQGWRRWATGTYSCVSRTGQSPGTPHDAEVSFSAL